MREQTIWIIGFLTFGVMFLLASGLYVHEVLVHEETKVDFSLQTEIVQQYADSMAFVRNKAHATVVARTGDIYEFQDVYNAGFSDGMGFAQEMWMVMDRDKAKKELEKKGGH